MPARCTHDSPRYKPRGKGVSGECIQCVKDRIKRQKDAGKTVIYDARYDLSKRMSGVSPERKARLKAMLEESSK